MNGHMMMGDLVGFGNMIKMMWGFKLLLHQLLLDPLETAARLRINEFLVTHHQVGDLLASNHHSLLRTKLKSTS